MALADITEDYGRHSKFERFVSAASTNFGFVSLMAPWNATMKQFAGMVTMTNILRACEGVRTWKTLTDDEVRKLAAAGIDGDMARRIAVQYLAHGDEQDGIAIAAGINWTDREALEAFRAAVVREVDKVIVTPGQDKPLWMSTELGKLIGQIKSFGISSMQKTVLAGLQQRDAAALNGAMVMMALGAVTYYFKQTIAGREVSDNPRVWAVEAFDWSGLAGWAMEFNGLAEKATRGRVGLSAFTGEPISRYASRNVYGALLGPTADAVADIFQVSGSVFAGDMTAADVKKIRQLVPYQNLFYLRWLFDQVEKEVGEAVVDPDVRD